MNLNEQTYAEQHQVFEYLARNGMAPTWVAGAVVANVPGITLIPGGERIPTYSPETVRTMRQAVRLVEACS